MLSLVYVHPVSLNSPLHADDAGLMVWAGLSQSHAISMVAFHLNLFKGLPSRVSALKGMKGVGNQKKKKSL